MHKLLTLLFFSFLFPPLLHAQLMPAEGSKLNYRLIGFKFPSVPHANNCKIEIASGNYNNEDSFNKHIIETLPVKIQNTSLSEGEGRGEAKIIAEVPAFGAPYTWRCSYSVNGNALHSPLHHFSTTYVKVVDTSNLRLRILQPALKYKDAYVFFDYNRSLYDMNGNPVWHLPNIDGLIDRFGPNGIWLSDLKFTSHNTITFIFYGQGYEINYEGDILWKSKNNGKVSGDDNEHYHHEFTRLDNGHYMVLGNETKWKFPSSKDNLPDSNAGKKGYSPIEFGTLIEYDENGNMVWSWESSKYFLEEDATFIKPINRYCPVFETNFNQKFDFIHPAIQRLQQDVHENAFFFDEKNKVIYVSFKNISRIIKLKYPEGTVMNTYGPVQKQGGTETGVNLFCHQHSCRISQEGYLYLFNNNICDTSMPKIEMFREPANGKGDLKKIWEYQCTVESNIPNQRKFYSGGNVAELPDRSMFVNMGSDYSKVFIVNRDKKILWSAIPEKWNPDKKNWELLHQYRSCIIRREQLENLIWNSEINE